MNKPLRYGLFLLVVIFIINTLLSLFFSLLIKGQEILSTWYILISLISSLVASAVISLVVILTAPVLKDFLVTYRTLLRLEALSHPLLLRLSSEAAGTYNHSLMVANLANKAAKTIGADSLLARIGGYYHDVGKLFNPQDFIENQAQTENPHETLDNPKKSAKIIINHVKEGIKLAKESNLPNEVIALIAEHQGTTLITYFYEQALKKDPQTRKGEFRYPGPKPMSREAAILMLADAIEARIRLVKEVTPQIISEITDQVIKERLGDKQLELSGLSAAELNRIRGSFVETLGVIYHQRIDYPQTGVLRYKL